VTIAEAALAEDPGFIAAALAHRLRHASDADLVAVGLLEPDCLERGARGFEAQAQIARALWPDELPSGTWLEREQAAPVMERDRAGLEASDRRRHTTPRTALGASGQSFEAAQTHPRLVASSSAVSAARDHDYGRHPT
jgi:hypothetical protein